MTDDSQQAQNPEAGDGVGANVGPGAQNIQPLNWSRLVQVISERKIDFALWATRLLTIVFAVGYVFPVLGYINLFIFSY